MDLKHVHSGKVRDLYEVGDDRLLMVASDRISAFDVVMAETIPDKGRVLTAMSDFWFQKLDGIVESHLITCDPDEMGIDIDPEFRGRSMLCHKAEMLPIECIVRGYITDSAWKEYKRAGTMHGTELPADLLESQQLPEPVFTPSTKATDGHDENISFEAAADLIGHELATEVARVSIELYSRGAEIAAERGIIIADTKFELGMVNGALVVADEVLTPDSSRFWPAESWKPGATPPSYDKQPLRDHLDGLDWDKQPPAPVLPDEVVTQTRERYVKAYEQLTGMSLADWPS